MRTFANVLISLIIAGWVIGVAVLSIQNVFITDADGNSQLVVLEFLGFRSVELPLGVVLALGVGIGVVGTAVLLPFLVPRDRRDLEEDEF